MEWDLRPWLSYDNPSLQNRWTYAKIIAGWEAPPSKDEEAADVENDEERDV